MKRIVKVSVSNAVGILDFGDVKMNAQAQENFKTTVTLKPSFLSQETFAKTIVNPITKKAEFYGIEDGNYCAIIERNGYLVRAIDFVVESNVDLGDKPLLFGDLNGDGNIDGQDSGTLFAAIENSYDFACDSNADGVIDEDDKNALLVNFGKSVTDYGDSVNFEN